MINSSFGDMQDDNIYEENYIEISIIDFGVGISEEKLDIILSTIKEKN
jgi:hypothetical protein